MKKSITKAENGTIKRNLRKWYRLATQDQKLTGLRWYEDAQDHSKLIADTFDIDRYVSAQVISALSPNNKWNRNKIDAFNVVRCWKDGDDSESVKVCTYSTNKQKAFDILNGKVSIEKTAPNKMRIKQIASNMTVLETKDGTSVLFSYETPVAGKDDKGAFRTDKYWSTTTTRHISKYLDGIKAREISQEEIDSFDLI